MKQGFVYMWVSNIDDRKYIGSHFGTLDDGYVSSSKYFNEVYKKSKDKFYRLILFSNLSREGALLKEQEILSSIDAANSEEFYNLHNFPGKGWSHHSNALLANTYYKRISESKKGKTSPHKGRTLWKEHNRHKLKIDTWEILMPCGTKVIKENMLEFCKEHNLNPSAMSAVARGKRQHYKGYKCKKITNNRAVSYVHQEWKSKGVRGKANFGSANGFSKPIEINGTVYNSMIEASIATGLSMYKLRKLRKNNEQ